MPSLELGFSVLHFDMGAPPITAKRQPCENMTTCTLYGLRIHPSINLVYHFLPDWEARAEIFGLDVDISGPIPNPRVTFSLSIAFRFY